ncbi:serpin-ZX-like [Alnus glutinosa]|uniref:serpin-ZX-like n=1 Tax=Alnus glutinosa TaxID=3517 RepID=UPI002D792529|nr:serpin-ZX-like [Alnus glutinosa]
MDFQELKGRQSNVALGIAKRLLQDEEGKNSNLVFSPLSIQTLLSLVAAGAKGSTLDQLLSFLSAESIDQLNAFASLLVPLVSADGSPSGGPRLSFANGLWLDKSASLRPSFKQVVDTVYKATLAQVDFRTKAEEVTSEVNSWVEKKTNGLIKEVLSPRSVNCNTLLILANALYFKGAWEEKFDASKTKEDDFHLLNGSLVQVPFMTSQNRQFVSAFDGFKVLRLPYKRGKVLEDKRHFSMYLFLPDSKDGLPALVEKVGSESGFLDRHIPHKKKRVGDFMIPKFNISFGFDASNVLRGLGLVLPFSSTEADLTEMAGRRDIYVSSISHKSFIEVNEEGTEAAACSVAIMLMGRSQSLLKEDKIDFVADHPFLFLIREDTTGTLLFIGYVLNPLEGSASSLPPKGKRKRKDLQKEEEECFTY